MSKTLLIDSNYICHRARFAIHRELSHEGQDTKVIFGFLMELLQLHRQFDTREFLFFWDSRKNKRKEIYPGYKLREPRSDEDEEQFQKDLLQFRLLKCNVLPQIGFRNSYCQTGYESDDLMARLVMRNSLQSWVIVTGDEDMYQLLDYCTVWHPAKKLLYDKTELWKEYGITPIQWIDVKMIGGCTSDTVPGIPGVAEKTAAKYLRHELKPESRAFLMIESPEGKEIQQRNRELVALPLDKTPTVSIDKDSLNLYGLKEICQQYGLSSFLHGERWQEWVSFLQKG